jgi:hypothetical protein
MDVIGFLRVSLGSSTVQLHNSLRRGLACACSEAGFGSQNGDRAWGVWPLVLLYSSVYYSYTFPLFPYSSLPAFHPSTYCLIIPVPWIRTFYFSRNVCNIYHTARCHIPEGSNLHEIRGNVKPSLFFRSLMCATCPVYLTLLDLATLLVCEE